jgi:hypothetical protein
MGIKDRLETLKNWSPRFKIIDYTYDHMIDLSEDSNSIEDLFSDLRNGLANLDLMGMINNEEIIDFYKEHRKEISALVRDKYPENQFQEELINYRYDNNYASLYSYDTYTVTIFSLITSFNCILDCIEYDYKQRG